MFENSTKILLLQYYYDADTICAYLKVNMVYDFMYMYEVSVVSHCYKVSTTMYK